MSQQIDTPQQAHESWYVMWHLSPQQIETMLQMDSDGLFRKPDEQPLPPYRFYIPFQNMPILHGDRKDAVTDKRYKAQDDQNALRDDLHDFVFIQASEERIRAIVSSEWNRKARLRLNYYRDTDRKVVTIPDAEMRMLITTIQDRHLQFYIDQPINEFTPGDRVILKMEPWVGRRGDVKKMSIKHGQLCMTIAMNILGRTKSINFTDIRPGDVVFEDVERGRVLSANPITNYEEEIIDILSHRFGRNYTDDVAQVDQMRLKRLATYDHIFVEDDNERARFTALKLMCAYLRADKKRREQYTQKALSLLGQLLSANSQPSDASAYLMTALFVTTRMAHWRTAVKDYRNSCPESSPVFRRYHAILKDLKTKKS